MRNIRAPAPTLFTVLDPVGCSRGDTRYFTLEEVRRFLHPETWLQNGDMNGEKGWGEASVHKTTSSTPGTHMMGSKDTDALRGQDASGQDILTRQARKPHRIF